MGATAAGFRWASNGSYGGPEVLICGVPVTCTAIGYRRVEGLPIDDFAHGMIDRTAAELKEELAQLEQLTASFRVSTGSGLSRIKGLGWAEG